MGNKYLDISIEKVIKQEVNVVLKQIKAEITHLPFTMFDKKEVLNRQEVIQIINKHIGESEE